MGVLFYTIIIIINLCFFGFNAQNFSIDKECITINECNNSDSLCFNNECKCGPNFRWNTNSNDCEFFICNQDIDCQEFDRNRVCVNQSRCECRKGYAENNDTKICERLPINCTSNRFCQSYGDMNQVCVDNLCQCLPNHRWNSTHQRCTYFNCNYESDCQDYDQNRICLKNKCVCSLNFVEDFDTKKCFKMKIKFCTNSDDCGQNQFCIDNQCRCQPNYKYSAETKNCKFHSCKLSSDCNQYDGNSICAGNGLCECRSDYVLDPKTKICSKTVEKYCNNIEDCGEHQFCINNLCECQSGYEYNQFQNSCKRKLCYVNSDCNSFDKNSVCTENECKCKSGYALDPNTETCKITVEKSCDSRGDCGSNQFCAKNLCQCQPNYFFDDSVNFCQFKSCNYDSDCNQIDINRVCNTYNNMCDSCKAYYKIDTNTKFCNTTVGMYCSTNYDCTKYGDYDQICVDNRCYCKPNYKLDTDLGYCSYHNCLYDSDCQTYDNHRMCNSITCECDTDYKEDSFSLKCTYSPSNNLINSDEDISIWVFLFVITSLLLLITWIGICFYASKSKKADSSQESNSSVDSVSRVIQPNQYQSSDSHNIDLDNPPPPYSIN